MGYPKQSIGEVEVVLGRYELRRSGRRIKLEKKPMELLIFLLERREQMVSSDDIVKKMWRSNLFIDTETNVNNVWRKLRTALGAKADSPRFVETVVGKGYRFVGPVRVIGAKYPLSEPERDRVPTDVRKDGREWGERSSIAVVPLLLRETATDDRGLCLGFADALVSLLGNLSGVDVLPTSTVLNLPLELTPSEIASRLGVRFVVHGAIQISKGQWRLSLEMLDTYLQRPSFTKKCDLDMDRLSSLEGDIAKQITRALNRPYGP